MCVCIGQRAILDFSEAIYLSFWDVCRGHLTSQFSPSAEWVLGIKLPLPIQYLFSPAPKPSRFEGMKSVISTFCGQGQEPAAFPHLAASIHSGTSLCVTQEPPTPCASFPHRFPPWWAPASMQKHCSTFKATCRQPALPCYERLLPDPMGPGWFLRNHVDSAQLWWKQYRFSTSWICDKLHLTEDSKYCSKQTRLFVLNINITGIFSGLWLHGTSIYNALYGHGSMLNICTVWIISDFWQTFPVETYLFLTKPFLLKLVFLSSFVLLSVSLSFYWKCEKVKDHLLTYQAVHIS